MLANIIAFFWGFAEATLFFFVPDIALSVIALYGIDAGLEACMYALAGALLGGWVMYRWGEKKLEWLLNVFLKLPAIRIVELEKVEEGYKKRGILAVLWGPLLGVPYKIYAVYAHKFISLSTFVLISIPARVVRFILIVLITPFAIHWMVPNSALSIQICVVLLLWTLFYSVYFYVRRK